MMKIEVTDGNIGMSVLTSHTHQMTKPVQTRRGTRWGWLCRFYVSPFCVRGIGNKIFKPLMCSNPHAVLNRCEMNRSARGEYSAP